MRIVYDLDNTLCVGRPYHLAKPVPGAADHLRKIKDEGHTIIINTGRGMESCKANQGKVMAEIGRLTLNQLDAWGFEYDEIYFGKPSGDVYIDDKGLNVVNLEQDEEYIDALQQISTALATAMNDIE